MSRDDEEMVDWVPESILLAVDADGQDVLGPRSRYSPSSADVWSFQLARAMLVILARRMGAGFAAEVRQELREQSERYQRGDEYDRADAPHIRQLVHAEMWEKLITSSPAGPLEGQRPAPRW